MSIKYTRVPGGLLKREIRVTPDELTSDMIIEAARDGVATCRDCWDAVGLPKTAGWLEARQRVCDALNTKMRL